MEGLYPEDEIECSREVTYVQGHFMFVSEIALSPLTLSLTFFSPPKHTIFWHSMKSLLFECRVRKQPILI